MMFQVIIMLDACASSNDYDFIADSTADCIADVTSSSKSVKFSIANGKVITITSSSVNTISLTASFTD